MANPLKQLASDTAIYGLSTILARVINFLFVPFYTRLLTTEQYGVVTEFMAYIAVLQVILVLGLETACFRFANKEGYQSKKVFSTAFIFVAIINIVALLLFSLSSSELSSFLGYEDYPYIIVYIAGILCLDNTTAILFAKLRQERKAFKFAIFRTIKILIETLVNILLFFPFASYCRNLSTTIGAELSSKNCFLLNFVSAQPDFTYPIFAILLSSICCFCLFLPELILSFEYEVDKKTLKAMLYYAIPIMIASLPGIINDFVSRILFRYCENPTLDWRESLGIFQASVKLAVIMYLFIQMFRFAAEPFFFQKNNNKESKNIYALVMEFFTAFCGLIFLAVILYIDILSLILGKNFREGITVVPIMLLSYIFLGMLFNVNMWYKLADKTKLAVWITLFGLVVTILVNIIFMPKFSYKAAAYGYLASYFCMFLLSTYIGRKYYPIPYNWKRIFSLLIFMGVLYIISLKMDTLLFDGGIKFAQDSLTKICSQIIVHTVILLIYVIYSYILLKDKYKNIQNI